MATVVRCNASSDRILSADRKNWVFQHAAYRAARNREIHAAREKRTVGRFVNRVQEWEVA
jgi:hypothetical protein